MADKYKFEFRGVGNTLDAAVSKLNDDAKAKGFEPKIPGVEQYSVELLDSKQNVLGQATSTNYNAAFETAVGNAAVKYDAESHNLRVTAYAGKIIEPAHPVVRRPSGAAPYTRNTARLTDLF